MKQNTRREFLKFLGSSAALMSTVGLTSCNKKPSQPNVILIIGDDIGWSDFGCYGHPTIKTPHLDKMASEGIRFTNTFLTISSCSPSRCSIITGRYPHNTGAAELHTGLPANQIPFPLKLKEKGYYCAQGGKWHMGDEPRVAFETSLEVELGNNENNLGGEKDWIPLLKNRPKDKPFFMWFAAIDAHRGWDDEIEQERHKLSDVQVPRYMVDAKRTRKDLAQYYDEIMRLDSYVGKVEAELEKQGIADNTMIIFMADNGRPFPRCKTRVYDSGMKTPFIIKWPAGIKKPGSVCNSLVSAIDIAPTILDVCGLPNEASLQGVSFSPLLKNAKAPFRNYVFSEHNWHDHEALERMARSKDYLYVLNERPQFANCGPADSNGSDSQKDLIELAEAGNLSPEQNDSFLAPRPTEELFDVKKDPEQFNNVAGDPRYVDALKEMRQVMKTWRDETADTTPEKLTPDWYARVTGEPLDIKRTRGEMPGVSKNAMQVNAKGPF